MIYTFSRDLNRQDPRGRQLNVLLEFIVLNGGWEGAGGEVRFT